MNLLTFLLILFGIAAVCFFFLNWGQKDPENNLPPIFAVLSALAGIAFLAIGLLGSIGPAIHEDYNRVVVIKGNDCVIVKGLENQFPPIQFDDAETFNHYTEVIGLRITYPTSVIGIKGKPRYTPIFR